GRRTALPRLQWFRRCRRCRTWESCRCLWGCAAITGTMAVVESGMRADQATAAQPGLDPAVELFGLGAAGNRAGQDAGQGALVGVDRLGEGVEAGAAQLVALGRGLFGVAERADLDGESDAAGRRL